MANFKRNDLDKLLADGSKISQRYKTDASFKKECDTNPKKILAEMGVKLPDNINIEVHVCDDKTFYFAMPVNPNIEINEESLAQLNAAKGSLGSAGSASSFGTLSSALSTIGSASTTGTASTAGCS